MPTVFCDNHVCIFIDEDGFCDCDKLDIVGGECIGSVHGGRSVTESDTCEKLKTENKKLRVEWESERDYANQMEASAERLQTENAKLRELCEGMLVCYEPCNEHLDARTDCPLYDENEPLRCRKARLLRELGIGG